ncbi:MAG: iron chelate uptake ABC transporter family permease subunit [archaeon]|nr:iron chelate uptake ABC transporter family permease subunit [archaeon]MCP8305668.1 iron chelate uptake ABC transporter family permease subunit [archaeon]
MRHKSGEKDYFERFARWKMIIIFLVLALMLTITFAVTIGPKQIPPLDAWRIIVKNIPFLGNLVGDGSSGVEYSVNQSIVLQIRLPRIIAATIVGVALAVAGVVLQGLLRNPMADPYVIGISSGAALGASIVIGLGIGFSFLGIDAIQLMAFIGGLITVFVVYNIARTGPKVPMLTVLLAGIAITSFLSAIISFIMITLGESLHALVFWLFGSFTLSSWDNVAVAMPVIIIGLIVIVIFARQLNIMLLGDDQAQQLGVDIEKLKKIMLIVASLITAAAVSISGIIGFIGLIIPHIARILVGPDHRILVPSSALAGAIILVLCDTAARTIMEPVELPVGVFTAFFGVPFFLYLLRKKKSLIM